jgi:hypothetical protein
MTHRPSKLARCSLAAVLMAISATAGNQMPAVASGSTISPTSIEGLHAHMYYDDNRNLAQDPDEPNVQRFMLGVEYLGGGVISAEAYATDQAGNIDAVMPDGQYILSWEVEGQLVHVDFTLPFDISVGLQPYPRVWLPMVQGGE